MSPVRSGAVRHHPHLPRECPPPRPRLVTIFGETSNAKGKPMSDTAEIDILDGKLEPDPEPARQNPTTRFPAMQTP